MPGFLNIKKTLFRLCILLFLSFIVFNVTSHLRKEYQLLINAHKNKVVRYECERPLCGGWADRLKGIMGAYYWSVFTRRKFELNMQHPCKLEQVLLPNQINWIMREKNPFQRIYEIKTIDDYSFRNITLKKLNILNYKSDIDVIVIKNNLDWLLSMSKNLFLKKSFSVLGLKSDTLNAPFQFFTLYNQLFKLHPNLWERYNEFKKKIGKKTLICAQFRSYYAVRNNSHMFWEFINKTLIPKTEDYSLFLTTDDDTVYKEAYDYFGRSKFVSHRGITYHMDTGENTPNNCSRIEKTILDFHSLQLCEMAVISDSGYGKLGLFNRPKPDKELYIFKNISNDFLFKKFSIEDLVLYDHKF